MSFSNSPPIAPETAPEKQNKNIANLLKVSDIHQYLVELEGVALDEVALLAKNPHEGETHQRNMVELEGVEPSSERGNHTLSTRLSWTSFSCCGKTQATNRNLIP